MPFATVPEVCYQTCYNVYLLASSTGKIEELCNPSGNFLVGYSACAKCVEDNTGISDTALRELLDPEFGQFLQYCTSITMVYTVGTFTLSPTNVTTMSYLIGQSKTSATSTTPTSINVQPSSTSELDNSPSVSSAASEAGESSKTHLAGPIAGSLADLALVVIAALFFWRRRRSRSNSDSLSTDQDHFEKAQLHSDCVPKPYAEMTGGEILEMEGSPAPYVPTAEKPANETPARELPGENRQIKTRLAEVEG
ncbi:unnamed protein product [Clonostachys rosea]|uniref:WSC domain-containing protein n=1 Tax=Bionectria ochroleuca TaxID=29856 RepID=A0ABY6UTJ4_BIOOC|nr:unnamed protein product [Clonostachys rosea]